MSDDRGGLQPVNGGGGAASTNSGPKLTIVQDRFQEHASRACEQRACICAGASRRLEWCAVYRYQVLGVNSGALKAGLVFAKVNHTGYHYKIGSRGTKVLVQSTQAIEYWKLDQYGNSVEDCIYWGLNFTREWCKIESYYHSEAQLVVSDTEGLPNKTWSEAAVYNWPSGKRVAGDPDGEKTPESVDWTALSGAGSRTTKRLHAKPGHCADWKAFLHDHSGVPGGPRYPEADPGEYYQKGGGRTTTPPGTGADDGRVIVPVGGSKGRLVSVIEIGSGSEDFLKGSDERREGVWTPVTGASLEIPRGQNEDERGTGN